MRELARSNDLALLDFLKTALQSQALEVFILDEETSAIDGLAFGLSRRLMILDEDWSRAQAILQDLRRVYGPL
ncbi:MAG: DUF2007 domain-containing protein [Alphaproteobacteria bacterium]|jgi:hypothetical protein|nr:DUF2007 domain-containing protein [Alphaproteobacteria bacterium]